MNFVHQEIISDTHRKTYNFPQNQIALYEIRPCDTSNWLFWRSRCDLWFCNLINKYDTPSFDKRKSHYPSLFCVFPLYVFRIYWSTRHDLITGAPYALLCNPTLAPWIEYVYHLWRHINLIVSAPFVTVNVLCCICIVYCKAYCGNKLLFCSVKKTIWLGHPKNNISFLLTDVSLKQHHTHSKYLEHLTRNNNR